MCIWGYVCCGWCVYTCNVQGERKREMERVRVWQYGGCRDQEMLPKEATYPVSGGCRTLAPTHTLFLRTGPLELLTSVPDSLPILGLKTNPSKEEKQGSYQHLNMPRGKGGVGLGEFAGGLWPLGEKPGPQWAASNSTRIGWYEQAVEVGVWGPRERNECFTWHCALYQCLQDSSSQRRHWSPMQRIASRKLV